MPATTMMHDSLPSLCRVFAESPARVVCLGSAESLPSLWRGLCAWVLPSLCRVSGAGYVLGFCRVFAESPAWAVCSGSAESSPAASRISLHDQAAPGNRY